MNKTNKILILIAVCNILLMIFLSIRYMQVKQEYENFTEIFTEIEEYEVE